MTKEHTPQLTLPGDEAVKLDKDYIILTTEEFVSDVQGFLGWRVTLDGGANNILAIPLWVRDIVGRSSKTGSFIVALGDDHAKWVGHTIQFVSWQPRDRKIKVVK